jgi:hypothetical protein
MLNKKTKTKKYTVAEEFILRKRKRDRMRRSSSRRTKCDQEVKSLVQ